MINMENIIQKLYRPESEPYRILMIHSRCVADKALQTADRVSHLNPDRTFIEEASMLHDIGIILTHAPKIGCPGDRPYFFHGVLGRDFLDSQGLKRHGLVSERHTLTGITIEDIVSRNLGLPLRDLVPVSLEEIIVCYADKFFSKSNGDLTREKGPDEILEELAPYGEHHVRKFTQWLEQFGG